MSDWISSDDSYSIESRRIGSDDSYSGELGLFKAQRSRKPRYNITTDWIGSEDFNSEELRRIKRQDSRELKHYATPDWIGLGDSYRELGRTHAQRGRKSRYDITTDGTGPDNSYYSGEFRRIKRQDSRELKHYATPDRIGLRDSYRELGRIHAQRGRKSWYDTTTDGTGPDNSYRAELGQIKTQGDQKSRLPPTGGIEREIVIAVMGVAGNIHKCPKPAVC